MDSYTEIIETNLINTFRQIYSYFEGKVDWELRIKLRNSLRFILNITSSLPEKYSVQFNFSFQELLNLIKDDNQRRVSIIEAYDIIYTIANILLDYRDSHKLNKRCSETAKALFYLTQILKHPNCTNEDRVNAIDNFKNMRLISVFLSSKESNINARNCYTVLKNIYNKYHQDDKRETTHIPHWIIPSKVYPIMKPVIPQDNIGDDTVDTRDIPDALLSTLDAPHDDEFPDPDIVIEA